MLDCIIVQHKVVWCQRSQLVQEGMSPIISRPQLLHQCVEQHGGVHSMLLQINWSGKHSQQTSFTHSLVSSIKWPVLQMSTHNVVARNWLAEMPLWHAVHCFSLSPTYCTYRIALNFCSKRFFFFCKILKLEFMENFTCEHHSQYITKRLHNNEKCSRRGYFCKSQSPQKSQKIIPHEKDDCCTRCLNQLGTCLCIY